jgi:hypothetical protein
MAKRVKDDPNQPTLIKQELTQMPEGYFLDDMPNPYINNFVKNYSKLKEDNSIIKKSDFSAKLEGNRHTPLYNFLGYSSKKPYEAIEKYILYFSNPDELILDPFCGSGGVGIICSKNNRHAILIDSSPLETLTSKAYVTSNDIDKITELFDLISHKLNDLNVELYSTTCHKTNKIVIIDCTIWTQTYRCVKCYNIIPIQSTIENQCPQCKEPVPRRYERLGYIPWGIIYKNPDNKNEILRSIDGPDKESIKAFNKYDKNKLEIQNWDAAS